jgi:putative FmdB family regulatory protein
MPIYECSCDACGITFEILARVSESNRKRRCPQCDRPAHRMVSAFAIGSARATADVAAANSATPAPTVREHAHAGHAHHGNAQPGHRSRPTVPDFARLCWMDDRSAERFAAYKLGRGAEYDDKSAAREDLRKKRGLPPTPAPGQSNSPVAAMVARKKAEQTKKAAEAVNSRAPAVNPHSTA